MIALSKGAYLLLKGIFSSKQTALSYYVVIDSDLNTLFLEPILPGIL
jgi:hypothetical protein